MKRLLALCLLASFGAVAQSLHNGDLQVLGSFDASAGLWSKPMTTVITDPSGACPNAAAMVLNTAAGSEKGHISGCVNGSWQVLNNTSLTTTHLWINGAGTGIGPTSFVPDAADTLRIFDATPTTGRTLLTMQAGDGQSGSPDMLHILDRSGSIFGLMSWASGYPYWTMDAPTGITTWGTYGILATGDSVARMKIGLDSGNPTVSMGPGNGALDVALERAGPHLLAITQGASPAFLGSLEVQDLDLSGACANCPGQPALHRVTANTTVLATDKSIIVDASGGSLTLTLETSPSNARTVRIKRVDSSSNTVTLTPGAGKNIDGNASLALLSGNALTLQYESATSTWWIF